MKKTSQTRISGKVRLLSALFFISGLAALLYQTCWQRLLFLILGSNIEAVTVVVSVFMLGLGLGALVGGWLADRYSHKTLTLFLALESGIGAFGFCSPTLLGWLEQRMVSQPLWQAAVLTFLLLLLPTMLMGATLPLLVSDAARRFGNIGAATGQMYAVNTLGAALGALIAAQWLFQSMGLQMAIYLAASLNLLVVLLAWQQLRGRYAE